MDLEESFQTKDDVEQEDLDKQMESLISQWRKDREKLAARRRVEQYLELKRLRAQIGDVFDYEDL